MGLKINKKVVLILVIIYQVFFISHLSYVHAETGCGDYPGTYSFENDENGGIPYGWVDSSQTNGAIQLIQSAGGHNKVMELTSTSASLSRSQMDHDFDDQVTGTIELWMRKSSVNQGGPMVLYIYGASAGTLMNFIIDDDVTPGLRYVDPSGVWTDTGYSYSDDTWFHMHIEWNCTSDTWNLWVDGVQYLTNSPFESSRTDTTVNWMRFSSFEDGNPSLYYVDAIGYSWDPDYNIGDNLENQCLGNPEDPDTFFLILIIITVIAVLVALVIVIGFVYKAKINAGQTKKPSKFSVRPYQRNPPIHSAASASTREVIARETTIIERVRPTESEQTRLIEKSECPYCGKLVEVDCKFCTFCGVEL